MGKQSLSDLICGDLSAVASPGVGVVPSEESIRSILHVVNGLNLLLEARLIHVNQLEKELTVLLGSLPTDRPAQYQFVIEVGRRDNQKPGDRGSAHYAALDLFVRPGKPCFAFFVDHDRACMDSELAVILNKLHIQMAFVTGSLPTAKKTIYQADPVNCFLFSLSHLINSASDKHLLPLLESLPAEPSNANTFSCHWYALPPQYLLHAQSVIGTLFGYADANTPKERCYDDKAVYDLSKARFDKALSEHMVLDLKSGRVVNRAIKNVAAAVAGKTVVFLESGAISEEALIDICYQERYPLVCKLLKKALHIPYGFDKTSSASTSIFQAHPLFELVFSQPHIIEFCLKEHKFERIFNHDLLLELMLHNVIDAFELFKRITVVAKGREPGNTESSKIVPNLACLPVILAHKDRISQIISPAKMLDFLSYKSTPAFLKNAILLRLFLDGNIPVEMVERIRPHALSCPEFLSLEADESRLQYLHAHFPLLVEIPSASEDTVLVENALGLFAEEEEESEMDCDSLELLSVDPSVSMEYGSESPQNRDWLHSLEIGFYKRSPLSSAGFFTPSSLCIGESTDIEDLPEDEELRASCSPCVSSPSGHVLLWDSHNNLKLSSIGKNPLTPGLLMERRLSSASESLESVSPYLFFASGSSIGVDSSYNPDRSSRTLTKPPR